MSALRPQTTLPRGDIGDLRLAQVGIFALELAQRLEPLQQQVELRGQHRLDQVIEKPDADGLDRRVHRGVPGHEDAVGARRDLADLAQQVETVAVLQPQVGHDDVERVALQRLVRLQRGAGAERGVTLAGQVIDQHATQFVVVINDEDSVESGKCCHSDLVETARLYLLDRQFVPYFLHLFREITSKKMPGKTSVLLNLPT